VGSRHEKVGKTGLAHLFEHLMFNETEKHPAGSFDRTLEEAGAESNAATWVDWTFYHESIPKDRLGLVIGLEAERMSRLVLREPQVASEKEVVANERRYRVDDDVEGAVSELLYKTAYTTHAYRWPTIGWMADIEGFTTEDCAAFIAPTTPRTTRRSSRWAISKKAISCPRSRRRTAPSRRRHPGRGRLS
jgi:zinc protease